MSYDMIDNVWKADVWLQYTLMDGSVGERWVMFGSSHYLILHNSYVPTNSLAWIETEYIFTWDNYF